MKASPSAPLISAGGASSQASWSSIMMTRNFLLFPHTCRVVGVACLFLLDDFAVCCHCNEEIDHCY